MITRTTLQREADSLDRELFDVMCRIDQFEKNWRVKDNRFAVAWSALDSARSAARKHMHPEDVEATKD